MKLELIRNGFQMIGARFIQREHPFHPYREEPPGYTLDISRDRHGEYFELRVPGIHDAIPEITIMQRIPRERHLLMMVRPDPIRNPGLIDRFLCGHDERHWFAAAIPGRVSSVRQAMESLKPEAVLNAQRSTRLHSRKYSTRNNRAFRRQGEWFFLPATLHQIDPRRILKNEPISRGRGKSHYIDEVYRIGGVGVWVNHHYPNGLTYQEYLSLVERKPKAKQWQWISMTREPDVYARGKVRHPDHRTITLPGWHRVWMNTENQSRTMKNLAFLD